MAGLRVLIVPLNRREEDELNAVLADSEYDVKVYSGDLDAFSGFDFLIGNVEHPEFYDIEAAYQGRRGIMPPMSIHLSSEPDLASVVRAIRSGACDFLELPLSASAIRESLLRIRAKFSQNQPAFSGMHSRSFSCSIVNGLGSLTSREQEIAGLLVRGIKYREMAELLNVSYQTVKTHIYRIYRKTGVQSRHELTSRLTKTGMDFFAKNTESSVFQIV